MYFIFEGIDGCGKTTQSKKVANALKNMGYKVVETCEPTNIGPYGKQIREKFSKKEFFPPLEQLDLFIKDRKWHIENIIKPSISSNKCIIQDRSFYSTLAYQGASGAFKESYIMDLHKNIIVEPSITFYIDIDPKIAIQRVNERDNQFKQFENTKFLNLVRNIYLKQDKLKRINGNLKEKEVFELIFNKVLDEIRNNRPIFG